MQRTLYTNRVLVALSFQDEVWKNLKTNAPVNIQFSCFQIEDALSHPKCEIIGGRSPSTYYALLYVSHFTFINEKS
jgi:hypothetical protein